MGVADKAATGSVAGVIVIDMETGRRYGGVGEQNERSGAVNQYGAN
jgi:hypothetical protein